MPVYHKLEEDIKNSLKGNFYGTNTVLVKTDCLGQVYVYEYEEKDTSNVDELEDKIYELENTIDELEELIDNLVKR